MGKDRRPVDIGGNSSISTNFLKTVAAGTSNPQPISLIKPIGCSFSLKQRKTIERKNGRVTPCNTPGTEELRQSQKNQRTLFLFTLYSWFFNFLLYRHQNLNQMQRDLTCVNLSTWKHDNHSKQKQKSFFYIYNLTQHRHIMLQQLGVFVLFKLRYLSSFCFQNHKILSL